METVIIFDIEASCEDRNINPNYNMETIEIGAVKIKDGKVIDEFQTFVKPEYVDSLTPFCTNLTKITYADLEDAPLFVEAILKFYDFIKGYKIYSCGDFDKKFLVREIKEKVTGFQRILVENAILGCHRNLKVNYNRITGKKQAGMMKMANELGIKISGSHHRALDDSRNLAKIYMKLEEIREQVLIENFSKKLDKIVDELNKNHHNLINKEEINSYIYFFDKWRNVILTDNKQRKLNYLTDKELTILDKYTSPY